MALVGGVFAYAPAIVLAGCANPPAIGVDANNPPGTQYHDVFCSSKSDLSHVDGPCSPLSGGNWNDCISWTSISLSSTQCARLYRDAGYHGQIGSTIWGPKSNYVRLFSTDDNDSLSSIKFYSKSPTTPAGNC
jgi:hypothetical protein